jgi:hypothetical protein
MKKKNRRKKKKGSSSAAIANPSSVDVLFPLSLHVVVNLVSFLLRARICLPVYPSPLLLCTTSNLPLLESTVHTNGQMVSGPADACALTSTVTEPILRLISDPSNSQVISGPTDTCAMIPKLSLPTATSPSPLLLSPFSLFIRWPLLPLSFLFPRLLLFFLTPRPNPLQEYFPSSSRSGVPLSSSRYGLSPAVPPALVVPACRC